MTGNIPARRVRNRRLDDAPMSIGELLAGRGVGTRSSGREFVGNHGGRRDVEAFVRSVRRVVSCVALGLFAASCGQDPGPTTGDGGIAGSLRTTASPHASAITPSTVATSVLPMVSGVDASSGLQWCDDVPPLAGDVIGNLPGGGNVDPIFLGVVQTYANEHRDTYAGVWIDRDAGGTVVVAFTDDPEPHRAELATRRPTPSDDVGMDPRPPIVDDRPIGQWDQTFDVVQATFTEAELEAAQARLNELFDDPGAGLESTGIGSTINRVTISLIEPTEAHVAALSRWVPADRVCVDGEPLSPDRHIFQPGDPLEVIVTPGPDGTIPSDTVVSCTGGAEFTLAALDTAVSVAEYGDPQLIAELDAFLNGPEGRYWPQNDWYVLTEDDDHLTAISADGHGAAFMTFEPTRVGWSWAGASGYSRCRPRVVLPDGLGEVLWRLDPDFDPPTTESTEIHVLVTEQACVGGQAMGDRLLGPQVVETDSTVLLAFAAINLPGAQACPGNPSTPVMVTLPSPLGDRHIRDGLVVPIDINTQLH